MTVLAPSSDTPLERTFLIQNKRGLHARASAKFVQVLEPFQADVQVSKDGQTVGGLSIMGLMMLGASIGTEIIVTAAGPDAVVVLDTLEALIADKFGEGE